MGRPGEQGPPVEGQPQKDLRPPGKPLGKGVDRHRQEGRDPKGDRRAVEGQQDAKGDQRLGDEPNHRPLDRGLA